MRLGGSDSKDDVIEAKDGVRAIVLRVKLVDHHLGDFWLALAFTVVAASSEIIGRKRCYPPSSVERTCSLPDNLTWRAAR